MFTGGKNRKLAGIGQLGGSSKWKSLNVSSVLNKSQTMSGEIEDYEDDKLSRGESSNALGMSEFSGGNEKGKGKDEVVDLRKVFVKDYGVQIDFPGYYIDNA